MSNRNRFVNQLTGMEFNGISNERAAEILQQWGEVDRHKFNTNHAVGVFGELPEKDKLEIPKKILYLENWGKSKLNLILTRITRTRGTK